MDLDQFKMPGELDDPLEIANFAIAILTNIGCIGLIFTCLIWWWKLLRSETTDLGWWFLGTALLCGGIWWWSWTGIGLVWNGQGLPYATLYSRLTIMLGIWVKIVIATKRKPMPRWRLRRGEEA